MAKKLDLLSEGGIQMSLKTTCLQASWQTCSQNWPGTEQLHSPQGWSWWGWISGCDCQAGRTPASLLRGIEQTAGTMTGTGHKNLLEAEYTALPACMQLATKPSWPNTLMFHVKHETRKKSPLCFNVSPLPLTDKTQPRMSWQEKESVQHLDPFSENKAVRDWFGAGSTQLLTNTQGDHATTTGWLYKALAFHICPTSSENGTKVYLQNLL